MQPSGIYHEVLVCYDVEKDKVRTRLMEALRDIGLVGIQKSVFWGYATMADRKAIQNLFSTMLDSSTDKAFLVTVPLRDHVMGTPDGFGYSDGTLPEYCEHATI